jgi:hypothetical protein
MEITPEIMALTAYAVTVSVWINRRLNAVDERSDVKDEKIYDKLTGKIEGLGDSHDKLAEKFNKHEKEQVATLVEMSAHMDGLMQFREECKRDFDIIKTQLADISNESNESRRATQGVLKMILEELQKRD